MKLNLFYPCHSFIWIFELLQGSKDSFGKGSKRKSALRKQTKKSYLMFVQQDGSKTSMVMTGFYQLLHT